MKTPSTQSTQIVTALVAGFLAIVLAACGGGGGESAGGGAGTPIAPTITTQPNNQSVKAGDTASFSVVATASETLTYQWKKNGTDISGATSSNYTTPATSMADSGTAYSVVVGNGAGSVTSNTATLTVTATAVAPTINTQPAAQTLIAGQTATFTVQATGTAPLRYQWKKGGTNVDGATSSSYTTPATSLADSGAVYSVEVINDLGKVTSSDASLTVTMAPAITTQPAAQTVTAGQTATFTVQATGSAPLRYQWKKGGTNIDGATDSSYTTPATTSADIGTAAYSVVVSNGVGTVTSEDASLTVTVAPVITTQPAAQSVLTGQPASFSVEATGTQPLTYQWWRGETMLDGATTSTYRIAATVNGDDGAVFKVVVSNSVGTATSTPATLTVAPVRITTQPVAQTVDYGQTASFSVTAEGSGTLTYQWKKGGNNISGATSSTYTTPVTALADSGAVFTVVVSNSLDGTATTTTSNSATLTVNRFSLIAKTGGFYDKTECFKDLSTGLIWEGKPTTGTRAANLTYSNYDSTTGNQKLGTSAATQAEIDASNNSIGYRTSVNASNLCGYNDWRLPTKDELSGTLASSTSPWIGVTCLSNAQIWYYWSSVSGSPGLAWGVNFCQSTVYTSFRDFSGYVRLVR